MNKNVQPDYDKLLDPLTDISTSVESMLAGTFGSLMGDQREDLKRIHHCALGLHSLLMEVITSLGLENIARRVYLEDKINTVLNPIIDNCVALIELDGPLTQDQVVCVDYILGTGRMLRDYIDKVWLYSQLVHKMIPIKHSRFNLQEVVAGLDLPVFDTVAVEFEVRLSEHLPAACGDSWATGIVLKELIENAIHQTQQGYIHVTAQQSSSQIVMRVQDSGTGIEMAHQSHIFEPFFQGYPADIGIGLGLSIVRELMDQQGGRVWLHQSGHDGTIFALQIPLFTQ